MPCERTRKRTSRKSERDSKQINEEQFAIKDQRKIIPKTKTQRPPNPNPNPHPYSSLHGTEFNITRQEKEKKRKEITLSLGKYLSDENEYY